MVYESVGCFLTQKKTTLEKIAALEAIVTALTETLLIGAGDANISEYMLNDGQTVIKGVYRSTDAIIKAIKDTEALIIYYRSRIVSGSVRMVDAKNLYLRNYYTN